jgi:hypothetical protein
MIKNAVITGIIRWAVNTVIGVLLAHSLISPADQAAWTNTFTEFAAALVSIGMLVWVVISNRWPNLVAYLTKLPHVDEVVLSRTGTLAAPELAKNPAVVAK